jgi:hypothetical protein
MFFKILFSLICAFCTNICLSEVKNILIKVIAYGDYYFDFLPRVINVKSGDRLNLQIDNNSKVPIKIFIPAFEIEEEIPKSKKAQIILFIDKKGNNIVWFEIYSLEKKLSGYIVVETR